MVQKRARSIKEGRVNREARIEPPKSTNYIVPAKEVNRPKSEIKLQQREIKSSRRGAQQVQPGQPARPERVSPAKPGQTGQPAARPERVAPAKRSQQQKPGQPEKAQPKRVAPEKSGQQEEKRDELEQPSRGEHVR